MNVFLKWTVGIRTKKKLKIRYKERAKVWVGRENDDVFKRANFKIKSKEKLSSVFRDMFLNGGDKKCITRINIKYPYCDGVGFVGERERELT